MPEPSSFTACGARLKRRAPGSHPYCRNAPIQGSTRCRVHGGTSAGPKTKPSPEARNRVTAAMVQGRAKWIARMREAKAAGLITGKLSTGGRPKKNAPPTPRPPATGDRKTDRLLLRADRAYRSLVSGDTASTSASATSASPLAVKLDAAAHSGLERLHQILLTPVTVPAEDPAAPPVVDPKRLRAVQSAAVDIIALAARTRPEALRPALTSKKIDLLLRLRAGTSPTASDESPS